MPLAEVVDHPAPALQVEDHLLDALLDRHIERGEGPPADGAVLRQPVAVLHPLHGGHHALVVEVRVAAALGAIVTRLQMDRKRGREGRSVRVSVDLERRRYITKKKKN